MKKILFIFGSLLTVGIAEAQFVQDYLRAADDYYRKGDYYSAAQYYEKYFGTNKDGKTTAGYRPYVIQGSSKKSARAVTTTREEALFKAAESYRQLSYHEKAEPFYKEVVSLDKTKYPLAIYHLATTQRALGKYAEAEASFAEFLGVYTTNDTYTESAKREIANLKFIQQELGKKDLNLYTVNALGGAVKDTGSFYAPVWVDGSTLLITSTKPEGNEKQYLNRVYSANYSNGEISALQKLDLQQPGETHQGVAAMTPDGKVMFLTRWHTADGKKVAQLYRSVRNGDSWSAPTAVASLNEGGANSQQPFVTADGKYLLYSSDRPGGMGGFDIWYAELDAKGNPSKSVNMGAAVNTKYDEQAPFYHEPSSTLVFSSNGRVGMGGFDFFFSKGTIGNWQEPKNFGYPVNSIKDDLYFVSRGNAKNILGDVLLSSDRDAACCLQLFSLKKAIPVKQIEGVVVACDTKEPLANATVTIVDENNQTVFNQKTDASGRYHLTLDEFQPLNATATFEGYHPGTLQFNEPSEEDALTLNNPAICLERIPVVGTVEVLENVYFEFNKATLLDESQASLDKLVDMLNRNPNMVIEIGGHTDSKGNDSYNQKLSEARAKSVVDYLVGKGIDRSRLQAKGYGESQPVAPNTNPDGSDNPAGREKNRRTEFKVLQN